MCQETRTLGQGSQNQPNGNRSVSNPVGGCPLKDLASIMVEVYESNSAAILKDQDVTVTLDGPSAGQALAYATATKYVTKLTPGDNYKVNVAPVRGGRYDGGTLKHDSLGEKPFPLGNSETKRVVFRLYPPATTLVVKVVDKDTGGAIPNTKFKFVARNAGGKEYTDSTDLGGTKSIVVEPGSYDRVSVEFTDADQSARFQVAEAGKATLTAGKTEVATVKVAVKKLKLVSVDPQFAPGFDELEIKYEIGNLKNEIVHLQVFDDANAKVFERPLKESEKNDGAGQVIKWGKQETDKVGCPGHALDGQFINPLFGPYKVVLFHSDAIQDSKPFNVLYHSLKLEVMPWDELYKIAGERPNSDFPDGASESIRRMWVQYKLNELGFWAGPVDGQDHDDFKKAVRRFRLAHPALSGWAAGQKSYETASAGDRATVTDEAVLGRTAEGMMVWDDALTRVLKDTDPRPHGVKPISAYARIGLENRDNFKDKARHSRLFVENHRFFISEMSEFSRATEAPEIKFNCEQAWLSRPHLPMRVRVFIKDRLGHAVDAPLAVGKAPLFWTWEDESETQLRSESITPALPTRSEAAPSRTQDFVTETQRLEKKGRRHGVPLSAGGLVTSVDDQDAMVVFRKCEALDSTDFGSSNDGIETGVLARAYTGKPSRKAAMGSSIVYLCPSTIAGDNYKVRVKLLLDHEPAKSQIVPLHRALAEAESGRIIVWRRVRLAASVTWGRRDSFDLNSELNRVKEMFKPCLVELEAEQRTVRQDYLMGNLINSDDFRATLRKATALDDRVKKYLLPDANPPDMSPTALWPGNAEKCGNVPEFNAVANRVFRMAYLKGVKADIKDYNFAMRLAEAWRTGGAVPEVRNAGAHFKTELERCVEASGDPVAPWKFKTTPPDKSVLTPLAGPTTPITPEQIEDLCLPRPVRDEFRAYAAGTSNAAAFSSVFNVWFHAALDRRAPGTGATVSDIESYYDETLSDPAYGLITKCLVPKSDKFSNDVAPNARGLVLEPREWVIVRIHSLAEQIKAPLAELIDLKTRKKLADEGHPTDGAILFDFRAHDPVTLNGRPFIVEGVAFGGLNGVALISQGMLSKFDSLAAHELAHCLFLHHWKNAPGENGHLHDEGDDNCLMSYPYNQVRADYKGNEHDYYLTTTRHFPLRSVRPHYSWDVFAPQFCGKCNLQLRGWKITDPVVPKAAPPLARPSLPYAVKLIRANTARADINAAALTTAGLSYYPAHKDGEITSGRSGGFHVADLPPFPRDFGFDPATVKDFNAFCIEVVDQNCSQDRVFVTLEARLPADAPRGESKAFPGDERKKRSLVSVECLQVEPHRYRSRCIRLVTDEMDWSVLSATKQGLLVTDMADGTGGDNDRVEILDQKVRVWYDPTPK